MEFVMNQTSTPSEFSIRLCAKRRGYRVEKARGREHFNNKGLYQLVLVDRNTPVLGVDCDASLEAIDAFLEAEMESHRRLIMEEAERLIAERADAGAQQQTAGEAR
jgi:hypothetical protein